MQDSPSQRAEAQYTALSSTANGMGSQRAVPSLNPCSMVKLHCPHIPYSYPRLTLCTSSTVADGPEFADTMRCKFGCCVLYQLGAYYLAYS
jgi:hypothetical protein